MAEGGRGWSLHCACQGRRRFRAVRLPRHHHLPRDACRLFGQCYGSQLRQLALEQFGKPRRRLSAALSLLDHRSRASHQYAAQSLVAGSGYHTEPDLAGSWMMLWRQANPGRELPPPDWNISGSGVFIRSSTTPIGPTLGILSRRWLHSSARRQAISLASTSAICTCSCAYSLAWVANSSRAKAGRLSSASMRSSSGAR
jgi:hypothetical protein